MVTAESVLEKFAKNQKPVSLEDLMKSLGITTSEEKQQFQTIIKKLIEKYKVYCTSDLTLALMSNTSFLKGQFHKNKDGDGIVCVTYSSKNETGKVITQYQTFKVSKGNNGDAIDDDEVLIVVNPNDNSARIVKVIKRNINNIVGKVCRKDFSYFVEPLDKRNRNLTIDLEGKQSEGQIVKVELIPIKGNQYIGNIIRVFEPKDDPYEEMLLEAIRCRMPEGFSKESTEQLKYIPKCVRKEDFIGRQDLREWSIISIDGEGTKDKDDCISIKTLPNGHVVLGVHIADVSYYVSENSPIDRDAYRKGTSYYFGGCVEPQLPHQLSSGICSLMDGEERLAKTILIEYNENGEVVHKEVFKSVIKSKAGMNYRDVNKTLNGIPVPGYEEYQSTLLQMKRLSDILYKKRRANGASFFSQPEIKFQYDKNGNPIDISYRYQGDAEKIIEEFMIAANINICKILEENEIPCIYRVHKEPDKKRLKEFLKLLSTIGMPFEYTEKEICEDKKLLQLLINHINGNKNLRDILNILLIRCMSRAKYSYKKEKHYGLSSTYTHFTSPIRRLADLAISRILDECYFELDYSKKIENIAKWQELVAKYADQASRMERIEEKVERCVDALSVTKYLSNYIGQEFEGMIVEIGSKCITVQLDNLLTGHVRLNPGDYYYNLDNLTLLSQKGLDNYYIGDRLILKLVEVADKEVGFEVITKISENNYSNINGAFEKVKKRDGMQKKHL